MKAKTSKYKCDEEEKGRTGSGNDGRNLQNVSPPLCCTSANESSILTSPVSLLIRHLHVRVRSEDLVGCQISGSQQSSDCTVSSVKQLFDHFDYFTQSF